MTGKPSTILVTGGAGYIGSHVVLTLLARGRHVVVLDDLSNGWLGAVPEGASFIKGDIGDRPLLDRLLIEHDIETVMHFAGSISVPESIANPDKYFDNNTRKTGVLLDAATAGGVRYFIFSSTAAVYGISDKSLVTEQDPLDPISPYGESKLLSERALAEVSRWSPIKYVALRYFNVAGADADGRTGQYNRDAQHLIHVTCQAALGERDEVCIFGDDYPTADGTGVRDYIHVTDLADAHVAALDYLAGGGDSAIFNCGYGRGHSVREVIDAVKRLSGVDFKVRIAPRRVGDTPALVADNSRIMQALDWQSKFDDLDAIIASTLAWQRKRGARNGG